MLDKKELNVMELNTVAGGNIFDEIGDFFEDAADAVVDGVEDAVDAVGDGSERMLKNVAA